MTIAQRPRQSRDGRFARRWHSFARGDQAVRHSEAWEHETFAEEQARWERSDPGYATICQEAREARQRGGEASRRADEAKAAWDAREARQRQETDDALRAQHSLQGDQTAGRPSATLRASSRRRKIRPLRSARTPRFVMRAREGPRHVRTTFVMEPDNRAGRPDSH